MNGHHSSLLCQAKRTNAQPSPEVPAQLLGKPKLHQGSIWAAVGMHLAV